MWNASKNKYFVLEWVSNQTRREISCSNDFRRKVTISNFCQRKSISYLNDLVLSEDYVLREIFNKVNRKRFRVRVISFSRFRLFIKRNRWWNSTDNARILEFDSLNDWAKAYSRIWCKQWQRLSMFELVHCQTMTTTLDVWIRSLSNNDDDSRNLNSFIVSNLVRFKWDKN